jgi:hypothetical protein
MHIPRSAIGALFAAATLTACDGTDAPTAPRIQSRVEDAGHNTTDRLTFTEPVAFEVESPCNGELIAFTGEDSVRMKLVIAPGDIGIHVVTDIRSSYAGIGQATSAQYVLSSKYHENFESPSPPALQVTFSAHNREQVISNQPGLSFDLLFQLHGVVPATGDVKFTKDVEAAECRQ